ncbi:MAG: hypothetical protein GY906_26505 [bacterium]|nr:hypothetical protein [bacterium]
MPPRTGARIATPRPRDPLEPTLIGGLARIGSQELESRRVLALEEEEREEQRRFRQRQLESLDLQNRAAQVSILRGQGFEEVPSGLRRPIGPMLEDPGPQRLGVQARPGVGISLGAVPEDQPVGDVGFQATLPSAPLEPTTPATTVGADEERGILQREPRLGTGPQRTVAGPPALRRLEPARDPSIVHPELLPMGPEMEFEFANFERELELPEGSLTESFQHSPVGTLQLLINRARSGAAGGRIPAAQLNAISKVVEARIRVMEAELEGSILDDPEVQNLRDEIDMLTIGLIQAATGKERDFNPVDVMRQIRRQYPNIGEDEAKDRFMRLQDVMERAAGFGRDLLEGFEVPER